MMESFSHRVERLFFMYKGRFIKKINRFSLEKKKTFPLFKYISLVHIGKTIITRYNKLFIIILNSYIDFKVAIE